MLLFVGCSVSLMINYEKIFGVNKKTSSIRG